MERSAIWRLLVSHGIPEKKVDLMRELYANMMSAVCIHGVTLEWFEECDGCQAA